MKHLKLFEEFRDKSILSNHDLLSLAEEFLKHHPVDFEAYDDLNDCTTVSSTFIDYIEKNHGDLLNDFSLVAGTPTDEMYDKYGKQYGLEFHEAVLYNPTSMIIDLTHGQFDRKLDLVITTKTEFLKYFDPKDYKKRYIDTLPKNANFIGACKNRALINKHVDEGFSSKEEAWNYFDETRGLTDKYKGLIKPVSKELASWIGFWNYESDFKGKDPNKLVTPEIKKVSAELTSKKSKKGKLYRGIYYDYRLEGLEGNDPDVIKKIESAGIYIGKGIESWTWDKEVAYSFLGQKEGLILSIDVNAVKDRIIMMPDLIVANISRTVFNSLNRDDIEYLSEYVYEGEVLIDMKNIKTTEIEKINKGADSFIKSSI